MDRAPERKLLGAYYTPTALVQFLVDEVVLPACEELGRPPRVVDPACGDGRLLAAAAEAISSRFGVDGRRFVTGVELSAEVAAETAARLDVEVQLGDGRAAIDGSPFDVVIGNPPYLSQLAAATARGGRSFLGGGPYADVAAEFLAASLRMARPDGGRVGLVLPVSVLATRDVGPIRAAVQRAAAIDAWWWADQSVFEASVLTGIIGLVMGAAQGPVRRWHGADLERVAPAEAPSGAQTWSWLVADHAGVPGVDVDASHGVLGDLAVITADFRDQYYGLVGAVSDAATGPPLVTTGLIDPGRCRWGERDVRFAKQRFAAPRVELALLDPKLRAWAASRLVPKVLVASQTRIIEAVVDERGEWVPSVPVVSAMPIDGDDVWRVAAVLTSPVASAWLAHRRLGSGMSPGAIRVTASDLGALPLPANEWDVAASALRDSDVTACGRGMLAAYGLPQDGALYEWWERNVLSASKERKG